MTSRTRGSRMPRRSSCCATMAARARAVAVDASAPLSALNRTRRGYARVPAFPLRQASRTAYQEGDGAGELAGEVTGDAAGDPVGAGLAAGLPVGPGLAVGAGDTNGVGVGIGVNAPPNPKAIALRKTRTNTAIVAITKMLEARSLIRSD